MIPSPVLERRPADSPDSPPASGRGYAGIGDVTVALVILLSAVLLYQQFWRDASALWYSAAHDRNGHYRRSQGVAHALRQGSVAGLFKEIHAATVWPPFHPLVTGLVLAIGGIDYRLAILPSLAAWAATCWFAFALARRLAPCHKGLAGGVALLFTLASPAYRAYATDIMLESLGAALTLAALYYYVAARQDGSACSGRAFAVLLLALFLTKYNYWTLLVIGLLLSALYEFRSTLKSSLCAWRHGRAPLVRQLRHPLTYGLLASFGLALYVRFSGPLVFTVIGERVEIETLDFPAQLCFSILLLRVLPWWWSSGRHTAAQLPVPARQLVHGHVYPLAIWFLWPRRLGVFLWYVTYGQHGRSGDASWAGSFTYYWQWLVSDYHANLTSLVVVLVLIVVAVAACRPSRGQIPVIVFLAAAALLTNYHSANRSRFLHSWLAVGWVLAGVGAARAVGWITGGFPSLVVAAPAQGSGNGSSRSARWLPRLGLSCGVLIGLVSVQGSAFVQPGHSQEGGPDAARPSLLGLADALVPELIQARRPAIVSNQPLQWLLDWRLAEVRPSHRPILELPSELLLQDSPGQLEAWLQGMSCDLLLLIDAPAGSGTEPCPGSDVARLRSFLVASDKSGATAERRLPGPGSITTQVWHRAPKG